MTKMSFLNDLVTWFSDPTVLWSLALFSVLAFVGSLVALPLLVNRLPVDYFSNPERRHRPLRHPLVALVLAVLRNGLAVILLLAGIAMLFLPGQGLLTIVIAIVLMDFPGKYAFERRLVSKPTVFKALNWIRRKGGKDPFLAVEMG